MPLLETRGAGSAKGFGLTAATAAPVYIEDVFSTWLYTGNSSTNTINNGIDLAGKGGLVWIKKRISVSPDTISSVNHYLFDTPRGNNVSLSTNLTNGNISGWSSFFTGFTSTGFGLAGTPHELNAASSLYASWTFRKQPKFFDVVTYTGNGVGGRTVAHALGSAPGAFFIKASSTTGNWFAYCRTRDVGSTREFATLRLNLTDASSTTAIFTTSDIATAIPVNLLGANTNGVTYVMYLFAHDAGGFGLTGTDNVISCGSFTADANGDATVNLGWEPQWILVKSTTSGVDDWRIIDTMRGMPAPLNAGSYSAGGLNSNLVLRPNLTNSEQTLAVVGTLSTGFGFSGQADASYIYIAIRRGPMKTPTTGTSVFYPQAVNQTDTPDSTNVPFPPDLVNTFSRNGTNRTSTYDQFLFVDRMRGLGAPNNTFSTYGPGLISSSTASEPANANSYVQLKADSQNITRGGGWNDPQYGNWIYYFMRRAPGFFDVVCAPISSFAVVSNHNLGVVPEMIIGKRRDSTSDWYVYHKDLGGVNSQGLPNRQILLNSNAAFTTAAGNGYFVDLTAANLQTFWWPSSSGTSVQYLFSSCPGVSRVGSYTGNGGSVGTNGSSQTINCGFTGGARFALIKCTSHTGGWFVFDSARGIVSGGGAGPYLLLNSTAAENASTDSLSANSTGFVVNQTTGENLNVTGRTYIYLAIA